ncbi:epoxide hydrolase [Aspergillus nomiae NRRL 13137]|uniref:Epoxide hydrolase n=1 Tax=Aspergillus nomiae NRRL (strain ATCC 15546 / NRRL 13137 / CBS 260.88 / M93) TaxID=1509407 RepID=A0A0L1IS48_ASPN3|nr:epoxide hydrolase [Aspergillus nomiae NRRL 13137]KNG82317.1 epoxide hydrolase [Aspergillus nomiae NRRL 13137]
MYSSPLKALVCLASFAVVSTSMPLSIEQSRHNAASDAWSNLPLKASIPVERIHFEFSQNKVYQMHESLRHTRTSDPDNEQRHWIALASEGLSEINGPCLENEVNRHPQFNASVTVDGHTSNVHFMALFSQQPDAIPIVFLHGWPGSFLDFTELLDLVRQRYSSEDCPFHLIVPSLPGYAYSAGSPMSRHADMVAVARTIDALLTGIGLDNGYIAQGGGVGAYVARLLGSSSPSCEVNSLPLFSGLPNPSTDLDLSEQDPEILSRASHFKSLQKTDVADHGKQVTLGVVPEKDPLSLLAWLSDKFNNWVDPQHPLPMQTTLIHASVYYLMGMTTSDYYQLSSLDAPDNMIPFVPKPMGYSRFPFDISGLPRKWAATLGDLVWYNSHIQGGHFAAMENPEELWNDVEHFVRTVFPDDLPR